MKHSSITIDFRKSTLRLRLFAAVLTLAAMCAGVRAAAAQTATATTLAVTSGVSAVTTVALGTVVTLTATVTGGGFPVRLGQVNFCDATAAHCTDIHLLATAQMTAAGAATFRFRPGVGSHSYKAEFQADLTDAASGSSAKTLTVTHTGIDQSSTGIAVSGSAGNYTLTASAGGVGSRRLRGLCRSWTPTTMSLYGSATLGAGTAGLEFLYSSSPSASAYIQGSFLSEEPLAMAVADFNGDGILDIAVANHGPCSPLSHASRHLY